MEYCLEGCRGARAAEVVCNETRETKSGAVTCDVGMRNFVRRSRVDRGGPDLE